MTRPDSTQQGGGVRVGSAARLAWWLCGAALAMMLVRLVVVVLGRSAALPPGFPPPVIQAIEVIGFLGAPILGGVIAAHRPENPMAGCGPRSASAWASATWRSAMAPTPWWSRPAPYQVVWRRRGSRA